MSATTTTTEPIRTSGIDPWVAGIITAFAILVLTYVGFISIALEHAPQIETSYIEADR